MMVEVNGVRLYYEKTGTGRPLVMLHGNGEDHTIFTEAAEILGRDFTCYLPDSRGHGRSTPVDELHYSDMADDVNAFIAALGLEDVILYGYSDGGIIGLLAAMKGPSPAGLIISGTNLTPRGLKTGAWIRICWEYLRGRDPKVRLMLREPQIRAEELKAVRAKTLVLAGSRDLIRERETRRIAEAVPGAELQILEGEDHGSYIVHQTRIAGIIQEFCQRKFC